MWTGRKQGPSAWVLNSDSCWPPWVRSVVSPGLARSGLDMEHDPRRWPGKAVAEHADHPQFHPRRRPPASQVFQPRQGGLLRQSVAASGARPHAIFSAGSSRSASRPSQSSRPQAIIITHALIIAGKLCRTRAGSRWSARREARTSETPNLATTSRKSGAPPAPMANTPDWSRRIRG